ncbi:GIY-YIG nuclease family protein [Rhodanobacter denitrificans]|uniref:GIY-YIG nuclease family protein n=1 Tax=Rhodanobacter denitrificans TaxID=666685 RepID=A0A368KE00_9GAMM|nr:GIY-YIG nuclease family protein [Rhodanobacter denitrificans]RCS28903.1 GIY-YIG nuclease family protein [Rhodanobacter denitrificans]
MLLFDLIKLWIPECRPENTKVHLARWNQHEEPHDVYLAGDFEEWQRWQSKHYFNREYVLSLIQLPTDPTRWVYVGIYRPIGKTFHEATPEQRDHYVYDFERFAAADEWRGRLYVRSPYKERNSFPTGERLEQELIVEELTREPDMMGSFPGFNRVDITMAELDRIVRNHLESWRSGLSSVKGIYLITDKNGSLYVGKADGADGIWERWTTYALTTHGNNVALMEEFGLAAPPERKFDLRFSILEIAPKTATDLDKRETHWKQVLGSRVHGYNRN